MKALLIGYSDISSGEFCPALSRSGIEKVDIISMPNWHVRHWREDSTYSSTNLHV